MWPLKEQGEAEWRGAGYQPPTQAGRGAGPGMRGAGHEEQGASPVPVHLFFSPLTTTTPPQGLAPCWQSAGTKLPPELMNQ